MKLTYRRPGSRLSSSFALLALSTLCPVGVLAQEAPGTEPAAPQAAASPAPQPQPAAPADASASEADSLLPPWEKERLSEQAVDSAKIRFRPGKGLEVASANGAFSVTTKVRAQILYTLEAAPGEEPAARTFSEGMQLRRARLAFQGNMFGKHNKFKLELAISPRDMAARRDSVGISPLLDWYLTFDQLASATVVAGQYKIPYSRQRVVSSGSLQFVDRSIVQSEFNLDRDIGLDVRAKEPLGGVLRYYAGAYIGEGRGAFELTEPGHLFLGRVEVLPLGKFEDYVEADFERSRAPHLSVGLAYAYLENSGRNAGILGRRPADGGTTDFHNATADFLFKMAGLSVTGEAFWRQGTRRPGNALDSSGQPLAVEAPRDGLGFFTQAGYLLPRTALELGARYGQMRPTDEQSSLSERHELGAVVGYYFAHHSLKLQADYFRLWGQQGLGAGDNQVRLQLEAGF